MSASRRQRGFTLLEVIVAFAVLALALTYLLGTLSGATRQSRDAESAARAALHAQSLLGDLGMSEPIAPGIRTGVMDAGRYRWRLQVTRWRDPDPPARLDPGAPVLLHVGLHMDWGDAGPRERLDIASLRWVKPDQPGLAPP